MTETFIRCFLSILFFFLGCVWMASGKKNNDKGDKIKQEFYANMKDFE